MIGGCKAPFIIWADFTTKKDRIMAEVKHEVKPEGVAEVAPQYMPSVYLEISKEQLDMLEVGKNIVMTLKGKVTGLQSNQEDENDGRHEIRLELQEVSIDPKDNEFSDLLDEDE